MKRKKKTLPGPDDIERGAFTEWCKKQGFRGVTQKCIEMGKRSRSAKRRKQATLAETYRKIAKKRKKKK